MLLAIFLQLLVKLASICAIFFCIRVWRDSSHGSEFQFFVYVCLCSCLFLVWSVRSRSNRFNLPSPRWWVTKTLPHWQTHILSRSHIKNPSKHTNSHRLVPEDEVYSTIKQETLPLAHIYRPLLRVGNKMSRQAQEWYQIRKSDTLAHTVHSLFSIT